MALDQVVREVGKGPLPAQVWASIHDDVGGNSCAEPTPLDCHRCRERLRVEAIEETSGNRLVGTLVLFVVAVVIGIVIGVSL